MTDSLKHFGQMTSEAKTDPIKKRKLSDDVQDRLLLMIEQESLQPGDVLPSERDLMVRHQVGRTPIREAMQNLQRMGLIEIRHGGRPRVAAPDLSGIVDQLDQGMRHMLTYSMLTRQHLKEARILFESEMARLAAEYCTKTDAEILHALLERQRGFSNDALQFVKCDGDLHKAIARISGNPIYEIVSGSMFDWLSQFHVDLVRQPGLELLTLIEHEAIIAAITSGNASAAKEAMHVHLTRANQRYGQSAL
jgi:GntR family transcriptional regulator, sialic acid-inducible nan operon repressor